MYLILCIELAALAWGVINFNDIFSGIVRLIVIGNQKIFGLFYGLSRIVRKDLFHHYAIGAELLAIEKQYLGGILSNSDTRKVYIGVYCLVNNLFFKHRDDYLIGIKFLIA